MTHVDPTPEVMPVKESTLAEIMLLDLDLFRCDAAIQTREVQEGEALALLRQLYRDDPDALPPVIAFCDEEGMYWLADGFYRLTAARDALSTAGPRAIPAEIHRGTKRDAILYAAGANKHGQNLSAAEKRRVVERLLNDPEWRQWSDRQIARHTGSSHVFVGDVRKALDREAGVSGNGFQITPATRTVQRGNTTYQMHTANIGHTASTPSASAPLAGQESGDGDGMEAVVTKGLYRLQSAWKAASPPARRSFREWLDAQPLEVPAVVASSEQTKRYSAEIAHVCRSAAQAEATAPEGFVYVPGLLSPAEQDALLENLRALPYEHGLFRGQPMKREWAQFGYNYIATSRTLEPAPPMLPFLQTVIDQAAPYYPSDVELSQCIVTHYPAGAGIGWHADAPCFGNWILGVSLASEARLQFRANGSEAVSFEVIATPGSLYVMQGVARWHYQHQIIPVKTERYSLTFRTLA